MEDKKIQKRTIESREKIITAAYQLFGDRGYYNTNTKEIAQNAGVSVGNFYNYYKDKSDLYCDLAGRYVEQSWKALSKLSKTMREAEHPEEVFVAYVDAQMNRAGKAGRLFEDSHIVMKDNAHLKELLDNENQKIVDTLEHTLRNSKGIQKRGSYPVMARMLVVMVNEISKDVMRTKGTEMYQEYLDEMIAVILEYVFGKKWTRK